jgi:hypothetical protein
LRPMLLLAAGEHFPRRHVQGGEEIEGPVAELVVGPAFRLPNVHRQDRLRTLQCLNL